MKLRLPSRLCFFAVENLTENSKRAKARRPTKSPETRRDACLATIHSSRNLTRQRRRGNLPSGPQEFKALLTNARAEGKSNRTLGGRDPRPRQSIAIMHTRYLCR